MFLERDSKFLTVVLLKRLLKNKVQNYSKMKKRQLVESFNKLLAVKMIIKNFRKHFYKNAIDNITLEPVTFPCFIYRVKCGKLFFYDYSSIIRYIMKTGKVVDPNTRNIYTDAELTRLDTQAKLHFPDKNFKSCLKIKHNENYAKRIKNRENEILAYQMRLDEIKTSVLTIIEDNIMSWNLTNIVIENVEYRTFMDYLNLIIHELKILFLNLKSYSLFESECFKTNFINQIKDLDSDYFLNILQKL